MSNITATINNVSYPVHHESGFNLAEVLEARDVLTFTVIDSPGTAVFTRGMPVTFSDTVSGILYNGYVQTDQQNKLSPDPTVTTRLHTITCMPPQYDVDKRSNETEYQNWYAGDIASDMVINGNLAAEGIKIAAALRHETSTADFDTGTLSGTTGSTATPTNDGDLELSPSGANLTYTESTTAQFGAGSLTGCTATNNTLVPTSTANAIKIVATNNYTSGTAATEVDVEIWSGSVTLTSSSTLAYDIFVDPSSPAIKVALDFYLSDGTRLRDQAASGASTDQQALGPSPSTDLTGLANVTWYSRNFGVGGTGLNGKTVTAVMIVIVGQQPGTYTAYIKNARFSSPSATVFSSSLNVNPPKQIQNFGYSNATVTVVPIYNLYSSTAPTVVVPSVYKTTSAISVDSVKLLRSSLISWSAITPANASTTSDTTGITIQYSLDGQYYYDCTNNAALPYLPAGTDLTGKSLYLRYLFWSTPGANVELFPTLESVTLQLNTSYQATKSDVSYIVDTQALWNAGTLTNTTANSSNELQLSGGLVSWANGGSQGTLFTTSGIIFFNAVNRIGAFDNVGDGTEAHVRLDNAPQLQNFTVEVDMLVDQPGTVEQWSLLYRTTGWQNNRDTYAYGVNLESDYLQLGYGTNSNSGAGSFITITKYTFPTALTVGNWHRVKAVVSGSSHNIYLDDVLLISATDSTYTSAGYFGLRVLDNAVSTGLLHVAQFNNFGAVNSLSGTWVSPSQSLTSAGTYGNSIISWRDKSSLYNGLTNTSILVEVSYNGGSTYTACTNGSALPGLTVGQSLSGVNAQFRVTLSTSTAGSLSVIDNLVVRVLGQYSSSGTRTTAPYGIDNMVRANAGSWGTAQDGQAWAKTGTGTVAISSNTATIANTTGDVDEKIGSTTATDQEATDQIELSASTMTGGIKLRYVSSTKYYKLKLSTTGLSIVKNTGSGESTLATTAGTYATNTLYYLRFRVVGSGPVSLYGKAWLGDGTLIEPGVSAGVMSSSNPQWVVTATD